jgi:hypothetical protein
MLKTHCHLTLTYNWCKRKGGHAVECRLNLGASENQGVLCQGSPWSPSDFLAIWDAESVHAPDASAGAATTSSFDHSSESLESQDGQDGEVSEGSGAKLSQY